ncbi:hypothetical protein A6F57_19835 [Alteromonas stellipolaris]|uniref:hypothetical protein n=1 Tax=Alteromonas stellipolaris TaxID=233316 RepID=UPI0007B45616|nr:hypothetical protein [Alteromonas stellipolaris]ANB27232.1 hypothetical protein A6F57_19835 [Alteromonas stellipolaris]
MIPLSAEDLARFKDYNPTRFSFLMLKLQLNGDWIYLTDRDVPVTYAGATYVPGYITSESIGDIEITSEPATNDVTVTLDARDRTFVAYFLQEGWMNGSATIYEQFADKDGVILTLNIFQGFVDSRDLIPEKQKIDVVLASVWADFEKQSGTKTNSGSQQRYYPSDTAFDHVARAQRKIYWGKPAPVTTTATTTSGASGSGIFSNPNSEL